MTKYVVLTTEVPETTGYILFTIDLFMKAVS
jgi:hypothetical protein